MTSLEFKRQLKARCKGASLVLYWHRLGAVTATSREPAPIYLGYYIASTRSCFRNFINQQELGQIFCGTMAPMGIRLSPLGVAVFCLLGVGVIYHLYAGVLSNRFAAFRWDFYPLTMHTTPITVSTVRATCNLTFNSSDGRLLVIVFSWLLYHDGKFGSVRLIVLAVTFSASVQSQVCVLEHHVWTLTVTDRQRWAKVCMKGVLL